MRKINYTIKEVASSQGPAFLSNKRWHTQFCSILLVTFLSLHSMSYAQKEKSYFGLVVPSEPRFDSQTLTYQNSPWGLLWKPGQTIRVKFLNGSDWQKTQVKKYAVQWTYYANLKFLFIEDGYSDIRVFFSDDGKSYSYIGTDAKYISQSKETMHFGWIKENKETDREIQRVVLHEFGHALGFGHEHQSPMANIEWNKDAIYQYYSGQFTKEEIKQNILIKLNSSIYSDFDRESVMMYDVEASHTTNSVSYNAGYELSTVDKQMVELIYPFWYTFPAAPNLHLPTVDFATIRVNHNIFESGKKGMRVYVNLTTHDLLYVPCKMIGYFYFENGQALNDYNKTFYTRDGKVACSADLKPVYKNSQFSNVSFFMPYDELHLANGFHKLYCTLQLFNSDNNIQGEKTFYFTIDK